MEMSDVVVVLIHLFENTVGHLECSIRCLLRFHPFGNEIIVVPFA